jgi:cell division transport system ATP-binding protein
MVNLNMPPNISAPMLPPMLHLQNVGFGYDKGQPLALKNLNLSIETGSFHLLTGPSGAGKTTLFNLFTLAALPTQGSLTLQGIDVAKASRSTRAKLRHTLGVVWQDFRLLPHLTVRENIELPLLLQGPLSTANTEAVEQLLEWVGLQHKASNLASALSGGEQQRTAIARAVVHHPKLLVADEPTGNLDATMARKILHLFTELHKQGTTIVLATHDTALINSRVAPILRLEDGELVKS